MRVVVAEDLFLLRDGLARLLGANDFEIAAAVDTAPALLRALLDEQPDVAVVDVRLPPSFADDGLRAALTADAGLQLWTNEAVASEFAGFSQDQVHIVDDGDAFSVVGFDDVPEAAYFSPPLTTVRQDFGALAEQALHLLMSQITAGGEAPSPPPIVPELVVRSSSTAP